MTRRAEKDQKPLFKELTDRELEEAKQAYASRHGVNPAFLLVSKFYAGRPKYCFGARLCFSSSKRPDRDACYVGMVSNHGDQRLLKGELPTDDAPGAQEPKGGADELI